MIVDEVDADETHQLASPQQLEGRGVKTYRNNSVYHTGIKVFYFYSRK